jgi:hypothetical protein
MEMIESPHNYNFIQQAIPILQKYDFNSYQIITVQVAECLIIVGMIYVYLRMYEYSNRKLRKMKEYSIDNPTYCYFSRKMLKIARFEIIFEIFLLCLNFALLLLAPDTLQQIEK